MKLIKQFLLCLAYAVLFVCMIFAASWPIAYTISVYECTGYSEATGKETKVVALTCYMKIKDEWYSISQIRSVKES